MISTPFRTVSTNLLSTLNRDLVVQRKGVTVPVKIDSSLIASGWQGGQLGRWVDDPTGDPTVSIADGRYAGIFLWGSNETADQYTSMTDSFRRYGYTVLLWSSNWFYTRVYERYGYMARHSLGPNVPLVYNPGEAIFVSENGKITKENESDFSLYPPHSFPNGDPIVVPFNNFGFLATAPKPATNDYISVQTSADF